jgi:hypothetical protein
MFAFSVGQAVLVAGEEATIVNLMESWEEFPEEAVYGIRFTKNGRALSVLARNIQPAK